MGDTTDPLTTGIRAIIAIALFFVLAMTIGYITTSLAESQQSFPKFPFNHATFAEILDADCISGEKKYSFSVQKMNALLESKSYATLPCVTDNAVEYRFIVYSDSPYPRHSWEFRSAKYEDRYLDPWNFNCIFGSPVCVPDNPFNNPLNDPAIPKSLYLRGVLIEENGKQYPGGIVAYIISNKDFECTVGETEEPCD